MSCTSAAEKCNLRNGESPEPPVPRQGAGSGNNRVLLVAMARDVWLNIACLSAALCKAGWEVYAFAPKISLLHHSADVRESKTMPPVFPAPLARRALGVMAWKIDPLIVVPVDDAAGAR